VAGVHDKGFPWGDGELFSDVLLVTGNGSGGYRRYCVADRLLRGLDLDVATGTCTYRGPIFELAADYATTLADLAGGAGGLARLDADIDIRFESRAGEAVPLPFPRTRTVWRRARSSLTGWLSGALPGTHLPGIHLVPHAVAITSGSIRLQPVGGATEARHWVIQPAGTFGECERGSFRSLKRPTLAYRYRCAVDAGRREASVQIRASTVRHQRRTGALIERLVSRVGSATYVVSAQGVEIGAAPAGRRRGEHAPTCPLPVLEIGLGHFPTAVFLRRIVEVEHAPGDVGLALEEDMSPVRGGKAGPLPVATVAAICDEDKRRALDRVLDATGFDGVVEEAVSASSKARGDFSIVIKPNFMFAYDKRDHSTFTDPELVAHLVGHLRGRGFRNITVAESHSTYGEYFDHRGVRDMADYLGFDGRPGYQVVDMTLDADERRDLGPVLGLHPVSRAWRDADFRISFAKNKTHAYAYYTLTIKNVYGALPLPNKFREYHCGRGIYAPTIDYLAAFPVHFGLIDAHVSADGAFGVFANPRPNRTTTVLGGANLVAVDWVGASRMGLDPAASPHMQLAVRRFGLPPIRVIGESGWYTPWRNVPRSLTFLANHVMDANYAVGRFLYAISAQMDEDHFRVRNDAWYMRGLRLCTLPLRRALFVHEPRRRPGRDEPRLTARSGGHGR
jgi:uncharacterized protein (DUF362 family)